MIGDVNLAYGSGEWWTGSDGCGGQTPEQTNTLHISAVQLGGRTAILQPGILPSRERPRLWRASNGVPVFLTSDQDWDLAPNFTWEQSPPFQCSELFTRRQSETSSLALKTSFQSPSPRSLGQVEDLRFLSSNPGHWVTICSTCSARIPPGCAYISKLKGNPEMKIAFKPIVCIIL